MKILATLAACILLSNWVQGSTSNRTTQLGGDCDSLLLTNGKWIAVRNVQRTEDLLLFSFCNDSSQRVHQIPIQQAKAFKNSQGERRELAQLPMNLEKSNDSKLQKTAALSSRIQKLAWLSLLGIFPLPILTQMYVIRKASALKKQLENTPEHKKYKRQLTAISIVNWGLLGIWVAFWSLVLLIILAFTFPL